ncbi:DUF2254 domain-containing protein [Skermanella mucosa]|uniref:DUF2254 domain-containing protein n=1 Tax=Skermanella mucosa TaxID=1789672 RepID=UPI00192A79DB|nr:DUF2254 domain-containing protein [Skermanella mucosa]UEM21147.1 DUF2254 domain-containing protein [Skermanella mucosa]
MEIRNSTYDRLLNIWGRLKTNLWFVPMLMTLGALVLAVFALGIDANLLKSDERAWWLYGGKAENASELLSTLLSSIITMSTLAISITMVVLTLAASQLGPRLIRNFIGDRRTQMALGFFVMTIVYLLLVYRRVDDHLAADNVPNVAITVGSAMSLACIFLLLFYVHHLASSIVSDTVINRVGAELDEVLRRLLPEVDPSSGSDREDGRRDEGESTGGGGAELSLPKGGYVQTIDHSALVALAREHDAVLTLRFRAGWHLLAGGRHASFSPRDRSADEIARGLASAVVIGADRTPTQDTEFCIRQLVEVGLRALSPGINDPYTAVAVIDRLTASLAIAMSRDMEPVLHRDEDGKVRLVAHPATFTGLVDRSFNEIRQAAAGKTAILIHLLDSIDRLAAHVRTVEQRDALARQAGMIASAGQRDVEEEQDQAEIADRHEAALASLIATDP